MSTKRTIKSGAGITETEIEAATDELRHALLAMLERGHSGYDRVIDCLADCERLADLIGWPERVDVGRHDDDARD